MHDCALGGQGGPSAPRVEHNYYIIYLSKIGEGPWPPESIFFLASQAQSKYFLIIPIPR